MLPTLAVGWQTSVVGGEKAECFCKIAGMSFVATGSPVVDTVNCRQPMGLHKLLISVF